MRINGALRLVFLSSSNHQSMYLLISSSPLPSSLSLSPPYLFLSLYAFISLTVSFSTSFLSFNKHAWAHTGTNAHKQIIPYHFPIRQRNASVLLHVYCILCICLCNTHSTVSNFIFVLRYRHYIAHFTSPSLFLVINRKLVSSTFFSYDLVCVCARARVYFPQFSEEYGTYTLTVTPNR